MVVIFAKALIAVLPRVEKQLSGQHLKSHAGQWPRISSEVVLGAGEDLRPTVLSGLDLGCKVVVLPAGVSQVGYFHFKPLLQLWSLVENQFGVEGTKEFFHCFLFLDLFRFLWSLSLLFLFVSLGQLHGFFLQFSQLTLVGLFLVFIKAGVLKLLLQLSYMGRKLCAKRIFLLLVLKVLRLRLGVINRSKSILSPVKFQPVVMQL